MFISSSCITRDPPAPEQSVGPENQKGTSLTDSPKFDDSSLGATEDDWGTGDEAGANQVAAANVAAFPVIYFGYDQATLSAQTEKVLQEVAARLQAETGYTLQVEGHCDERGTTEYNLALGDRRANTVRNYLESLGVPANRLTTISFGEERRVEEGHTEAEHALNRRVEFRVPSLSH